MDTQAPLSGVEWLPIASSTLGLVCAVAVVVLSLKPATARAALGLSGAVLGFGLSAVLLGVAGRFMSERELLRALVAIDPSQRDQLLAAGTAESVRAASLGAVGGLPLVVVAIAAMAVLYPRVKAGARAGGAP